MRVIIESPFKTSTIRLADGSEFLAEENQNIEYARACCRWAADRKMAPFASHLFYTQFLDDAIPEERDQGIKAGFNWGEVAFWRFFFLDRGFSRGMRSGLEAALKLRQPIDFVLLGGKWDIGWWGPISGQQGLLNREKTLKRLGVGA